MSQRVDELLAAARQVEVAEPPPLAAIRSEVGVRARRSAQWMAFAVAIPLGAAAAAGGWVIRRQVVPPAPVEQHVAPPVLRPAPKVVVVEPAREVIALPEPAPAPAPAPVVVRRPSAPAPHLAAVVESPAAVSPDVVVPSSGGRLPAPPSPTALSDEAALLTEALTALRGRHDAAAALDAIARYRSRFPNGVLATEMTLAAVEAQRSSGHTADALTELESLSTDARRGELLVLRAELRAELGRCDEARRELAGVLDTLPEALRRRALFTDASCAATLGARDEAVARLNALLALDPDDARARTLLEQLK